MAVDSPVAPFGATARGAADLVPEARLIPGSGPIPAGTYGITEAQVEAWVAELTGAVAMRLDGWENLSDQPSSFGGATYGGQPDPAAASDRDQLIAYARTVVHNGAASYLEAARHPERSSVNSDSYSAVLWQRYRDGLTDLVGWLERRLTAPEAGDTAPAYTVGVAGSFPVPLFPDGFGL